MSIRELVVLGTASQAPTRRRNHNGYLLRWDGDGLLFDPGEGTQRQLTLAGVAATDVTRICVTHFHGDHCLGLPGVVQRLSLDRVPHPVPVHFPAGGGEFFARLRHASVFHEVATLVPSPIAADGVVAVTDAFTLSAARLTHPVETYGYRLTEPDGRRVLPERLGTHGIAGPDIGRLVREGSLRGVRLEDVSVPRPGQVVAFVMDTAPCDAAVTLARGADLLVIEATFLHREVALASEYGHLTARQAGVVAAEAGARRVVLTHFSQRYDDLRAFGTEAAAVDAGDVVVASDLLRVPVPGRADGGGAPPA